jgi:uncharacterized membrane protein YqaE (UPF0057 family)
MAVTITDPIKLLFAILLPPLGVFLEVGLKGHFWLNILLTLLGVCAVEAERAAALPLRLNRFYRADP